MSLFIFKILITVYKIMMNGIHKLIEIGEFIPHTNSMSIPPLLNNNL